MDDTINLANESLFSENFKNTYNFIEKNLSTFDEMLKNEEIPSLSNILNFDIKNKLKHTNNNQINICHIENESYSNKNLKKKHEQHTKQSNHQLSKYNNCDMDNNNEHKYTDQQSEQKNPEKCGIKTLLNTKSKITYPFDKIDHDNEKYIMSNNPYSTITTTEDLKLDCPYNNKMQTNEHITPTKEKKVQLNDSEKQIEEYIQQESLIVGENFIETVSVLNGQFEVSETKEVDNINIKQKEENKSNINVSNEQKKICTSEYLISDPQNKIINIPIINDNIGKNFNDIENKMDGRESIKKIDIKNHDNIIVNMNDKIEMNTNLAGNNFSASTSTSTSIENNKLNGSDNYLLQNQIYDEQKDLDKQSEKNVENKTFEHKEEWPELTVDMIGTSFKVIGDLPNNSKLKIVNNTHLAEDNSYLGSISRYSTGQGRDKIISFLDHLFHETERNIWFILKNVREGNNVDTNVSILQGIIGKTYIFLHRYENMRNVYKTDSSAFARLGIIRDKFFTFLNTLFRDLAIPK